MGIGGSDGVGDGSVGDEDGSVGDGDGSVGDWWLSWACGG